MCTDAVPDQRPAKFFKKLLFIKDNRVNTIPIYGEHGSACYPYDKNCANVMLTLLANTVEAMSMAAGLADKVTVPNSISAPSAVKKVGSTEPQEWDVERLDSATEIEEAYRKMEPWDVDDDRLRENPTRILIDRSKVEKRRSKQRECIKSADIVTLVNPQIMPSPLTRQRPISLPKSTTPPLTCQSPVLLPRLTRIPLGLSQSTRKLFLGKNNMLTRKNIGLLGGLFWMQIRNAAHIKAIQDKRRKESRESGNLTRTPTHKATKY